MRSLIFVPLAGLLSFTLAAVLPQTVDTSKRGMVYGHLETPAPLERVELARAHSIRRPAAKVLGNGDFYFADIEPGQYVLVRYMTRGVWHYLAGDRAARDFAVDVEPGGIHFVGSWRVTAEKDGRLKENDSTADRTPDPAADQLLRRLRPSLRGTGWEKQIKR